jgi:hypothetical protein
MKVIPNAFADTKGDHEDDRQDEQGERLPGT